MEGERRNEVMELWGDGVKGVKGEGVKVEKGEGVKVERIWCIMWV